MNLPEHADTYIAHTLERSRRLIQTNIWSGLHRSRLDAWFRQFEGPAEQYFAARILDTVIYRSERQTTACMIQMFQRTLPNHLRHLGLMQDVRENLLEILSQDQTDPLIRIAPVLDYADPPTKSGPLICRLLRRNVGLSDKWMIWPGQVHARTNRHIKLFLFVDDFLGTGHQASRFFSNIRLDNDTKAKYVYSPLIAFEDGVSRICKNHSRLTICPTELLTAYHRVFGPSSQCFNDGLNSPAKAYHFYQRMLKRITESQKLPDGLGYGKLDLAIAFHHGTPNGSIKILWSSEPPLSPLFDR